MRTLSDLCFFIPLEDKLCNAGIIVGIARSEMCNQDEETSLVEDDKEIVIQDDTVEGKVKYHHFLSLNKTGALDEVLVEPRMVEFESNVNNMNCFEMASLADVCSAASQSNLAGEFIFDVIMNHTMFIFLIAHMCLIICR